MSSIGNNGKTVLESEKRQLISRFMEIRDDIAIHALYADSALNAKIPSKKTLERIMVSGQSYTLRNGTAIKLRNLLNYIESQKTDSAGIDIDIYTSLSQAMDISRENNRSFLNRFSGFYRCFRLTTASKEILVTHLEIGETAAGTPEFTHIEVVPDEAKGLSGRTHRTISHKGFVFSKNKRAIFVSPFKNMRVMSCIISSNIDHPTFTGLLLTMDALRRNPFCARVFITKSDRVDASSLAENDSYGLFDIKSDKFGSIMDFINNMPDENGVLFSVADI